jgi:prephenate dehydratase
MGSTAEEQAPGAPRCAFLGPAGTFSEEALLSGAEPGAVEPVAVASIFEAVAGLAAGRVELAIVPIENSLEGSINVTLDLLAERAGEVQIVAETYLRVRHSLIAAGQVPLGDISTVLSHPQVPGQCTRFLRGELPGAQIVPAASTAEAVRSVVAGGELRVAALGTSLAAEIYGATVLREGVEDREDNETRFVWLARGQDAPEAAAVRSAARGGAWRSSIVFWGPGADRPGWLVRCLSEFAERDINLTKIESRPRREEMGSYMFFADLGRSTQEEPVQAALAGLGGLCDEVRVLGSYHAAPRAL